jgi:hypothetical protein
MGGSGKREATTSPRYDLLAGIRKLGKKVREGGVVVVASYLGPEVIRTGDEGMVEGVWRWKRSGKYGNNEITARGQW